MGLLYMLSLDYPKDLEYTFEVICLFLGIGLDLCTSRVHSLKNKLLSEWDGPGRHLVPKEAFSFFSPFLHCTM